MDRGLLRRRHDHDAVASAAALAVTRAPIGPNRTGSGYAASSAAFSAPESELEPEDLIAVARVRRSPPARGPRSADISETIAPDGRF